MAIVTVIATRIIAFPPAILMILNIARRAIGALEERLPSAIVLRDARFLECLVHHRSIAVVWGVRGMHV